MTDNSGGEVQEPFTKIDKLIHEPSRYMLIAYLYVVEVADFLFLLRQTGMTWGNLSAHLSKLKQPVTWLSKRSFWGKSPTLLSGLPTRDEMLLNSTGET